MKTIKRLATFLVALLLVVEFSSCEKQSNDLQSVSFNIQNVTNSLKKATGPQDDRIPVCIDEEPSYVIAKIGDNEYKLNVLTGLNDGTETQVLKLDAGTYTLSSFKVYALDNDGDDNDELIWATPESGSYYANLFGIQGVGVDFIVAPFEKSKFNIDVLCWQTYSYKDFGFNWFDYNKVEIKTLCFFGDVCVEEHELWHSTGSYYQQSNYEGYDFPAIFEVFITNEAGDIINDLTLNSNMLHPDGTIWQGVGSPLCIEYPDYDGIIDNYEFTINLILPNGDSYPIIEGQPFTAEQDPMDITGDDGVYDFAVGALCEGYTPPPFGDDPPPPSPESGCETAFAKFNNVATNDSSLEIGYVFTDKIKSNPEFYPTLDIGTRWGWAGNLKDDGTFVYDIWAAAGKNDTSKGYLVGDLSITKDGNSVSVTYNMDSGYSMEELHIYAMDTTPTNIANGNFTYGDNPTSGVFESLSDGDETHFTLNFDLTDNDGDGIWFIAHAVVCDDD